MFRRFQTLSTNMTFRRKILLLWLWVGVVPMILIVVVFIWQVTELVGNQGRYALKQNFEQSCQAMEDKVGSMEEIANFLLANGKLQEAFREQHIGLDDIQYLEQYENVEEARRIFVDSNSVDEIVFYLDSGLPMVGKSSGNKYRDISLLQQEEWCSTMVQNQEYAKWGIITKDPTCFLENYLSYVHVIQDSQDFSRVTGYVVLGIRQEKLKMLLVPVLEEQFFYLETDGGTVFCGKSDGEVLDNPVNDSEVVHNGTTYYCLCREIDSTGVILVSATPKAVLTRQTLKGMAGLAMLLALFLGIICLVYLKMSNRLTVRIIRLADVCQKSEEGTLLRAEEDPNRDEIGTLCRAYNHMTDKIEDLLAEQYRIGEEVKDAQLKALQAQINPHFLYNTLEMVNWMAEKEDKRSVQNIVRNLSRYYKSVLNKGKDEIGIWDEIHMGMAYMEIQACRFKGKIDFCCEVDESIPELEVPKLILQPLLENAIFHGITKKEGGRGRIWLKGYWKDGKIVLEVSDDGVGFRYGEENTQAADRKESGSRYGFANIQSRIGLFWKGEAEMKVESTPGIGTSIYIVIPDMEKREKGEQ